MALEMTAAETARQGYAARWCRYLVLGVAVMGPWVGASAKVAASEPDSEHTGFTVPQADDDFTTALSDFERYSAKGEWEKAIRSLSKLHEADPDQLCRGNDGLIVPVRLRIWEAVVSLPPEGRRAFDVFFSGQASELAKRMLAPDARENGEDITLAGQLYDRYFISEHGVAAADLLGDAAFERGRFHDAAGYFRAILEHHDDAEIPEARIAVKLGLALRRAGLSDEFEKQRELVRRRYPDQSVVLGGQTLSAPSALNPPADSPAAEKMAEPTGPKEAPSAAAPDDDAPLLWQVRFMSDAAQSSLKSALANWWGPSSGLSRLVPANAADGGRIYCNWLGICFAVDAETGKLLWRTDKFSKLDGKFQQFQYGSGIASRYEIAAAGDTVVTVSLPLDRINYGREPYRLSALDAATGESRWDSNGISSLKEMSFTGQPLIVGDQVLAVCHSKQGADAHLKALSIQDGQETWDLPLGQAAMTATPRGQQIIPEPTLMLDGDLLYVLTNNGALLVIDLPQRRIKWALSYPPPPGTGNQRNNVFFGRGPSDAGRLHTRGVVRRYEGVLYFKESGSRTLYALDPLKREIIWKRPVNADAKIVGFDPGRVYLLGHELLAIDRRTRGLKWSTKLPIGAGGLRVIQDDQRVTVLTGRGIYEINKTNGDILRIFRGHDLTSQGGSVDARGGKLVCISNDALSAYKLVGTASQITEIAGN